MMPFSSHAKFTELEEDHPNVIRSLAAFDLTETLAVIAGLLTVPHFHVHTIRLELLQNLIHRNARGRNRPTRHRIGQWLNQGLGQGWAARMEDPVEDVFISNVVTSLGNSRIFEGIWEANDFWLQEALSALKFFRNEAWAVELIDQCFSILALSEALAERCGVPRYCMGGGEVRGVLLLPTEAELYARAALVRFSQADLNDLGVSLDRLTPFLHDMTPCQGGMGNSTLERRPLVRDGSGVLIAIPTAISPAIRLQIVEALVRNGLVEKFQEVLFSRQREQLFNRSVSALDGEVVHQENLLPLPPDIPAMTQRLIAFDQGKFAHVLFFEDSIMEFFSTGPGGTLDLADERIHSLHLYCQRFAEHVATQPGYNGGLTVAVIGGLGRASLFRANKLPPRWHLTGFRLPDFLALGRVRDTDFLRIWKLKDQENELGARGVRLANLNGDLNLLGYWIKSGERLIPRDTSSSKTILQIGTDFVADIRHDLRRIYDLHAVRRCNPDCWVVVQRYNAHPFFKELELDPVYFSESGIVYGQLCGLIETQRNYWWVSSLQQHQLGCHRNIQLRIWEALLSWMARVAPIAETVFQNLRRGPLEIVLKLDGLENWTTEGIDDLPEPVEVSIRVDGKLGRVEISLPLGFFRYFATPKNIAERKLIRAAFEGIAALDGLTLNPQALDDLVQRVVRNDDARFFHLAFAQDYRQHVASLNQLKPRFVSEGESNFECIGLAHRLVGDDDINRIEGLGSCSEFLHGIVDECWNQLRVLLAKLDRYSVVRRALKNSEAIECDKRQWTITASALLATHEDRADVVNVAHRRNNKRAEASLASRIVVEMAVCTCPSIGGAAISEADFDRLLAVVHLLLYAANSSDAIEYSLTEEKVHIFRNGEFLVDDKYVETILSPYIAEHFSQQFSEAATHYSSYYRDPREAPNEAETGKFESFFVKAFQAEYGISPEELLLAKAAIERDALSDERLVVERTHSHIRHTLLASDLSAEMADRIFEHFSLWPRGKWDKTPNGFTQKDWYPWRYRRRLSLLARPFVRLGEGDDAKILFAPGIMNDSFDLLIGRLLGGRLPAEDFRSSEMRAWIGEVTRLRGDDFEERVADELRTTGWKVIVGAPMTQFGADESYGDLDILAWSSESTCVLAIECKRLRFAQTVAEVGEQLRGFKGKEMDRLDRHMRRCEWLEKHPDELCRLTRTDPDTVRLTRLLVTSTVVPMQYSRNLPLPSKCIVPISRLKAWVRANA